MVSDAFNIALSGLKAAEKQIGVSADNIANARTPEYKAKELKQSTNNVGGVDSKVVDRDPATIESISSNGNIEQMPNVSLEEEVVNAEIATYNFKANLQVIKRQKEIESALLDIQA